MQEDKWHIPTTKHYQTESMEHIVKHDITHRSMPFQVLIYWSNFYPRRIIRCKRWHWQMSSTKHSADYFWEMDHTNLQELLLQMQNSINEVVQHSSFPLHYCPENAPWVDGKIVKHSHMYKKGRLWWIMTFMYVTVAKGVVHFIWLAQTLLNHFFHLMLF